MGTMVISKLWVKSLRGGLLFLFFFKIIGGYEKCIYTGGCCDIMPWAKNKSKPKSYLITPGRDTARNELWDELDEICKKNDSTHAEEIWDAIWMHVERAKRN